MTEINTKIISCLSLDQVINSLNTTITKYGQIRFSEIGTYLLSDTNKIKNKQNIIRNILNNPDKITKIENLLKIIKTYEQCVYDFFTNNIPTYYFTFLIQLKYILTIYNPFIITLILIYFMDQSLYSKYTCLFLIYVYLSLNDSARVYKSEIDTIINKVTKMTELFDYITEVFEEDIFTNKNEIKDDLEYLTTVFTEDKITGSLVKIYYENEKFSDQITSTLKYIGKIDSYITLANLIRTGLCTFPVIEESKNMYLYAQNIINPLESSEPFDFFIGNPSFVSLDNTQHINGILINIIFAQTYGIVFGTNETQFIFTPFSNISLFEKTHKRKKRGIIITDKKNKIIPIKDNLCIYV